MSRLVVYGDYGDYGTGGGGTYVIDMPSGGPDSYTSEIPWDVNSVQMNLGTSGDTYDQGYWYQRLVYQSDFADQVRIMFHETGLYSTAGQTSQTGQPELPASQPSADGGYATGAPTTQPTSYDGATSWNSPSYNVGSSLSLGVSAGLASLPTTPTHYNFTPVPWSSGDVSAPLNESMQQYIDRTSGSSLISSPQSWYGPVEQMPEITRMSPWTFNPGHTAVGVIGAGVAKLETPLRVGVAAAEVGVGVAAMATPTGFGQVAGFVTAAHGADNLSAMWTSFWTGTPTPTYTARGVQKGLELVGMDSTNAQRLGEATNSAAPMLLLPASGLAPEQLPLSGWASSNLRAPVPAVAANSGPGTSTKISVSVPQTAGEWTAPEGWRLPVNNGEWSGTTGNSLWKSNIPEVNQMTGNRAIPFQNGYIDSSYYKAAEYRFTNLNGTNADFTLADQQLAIDRGFNSPNAARVWRTQNGLTWHHVEDGQTLQLVPTVLNDIPHQGGASILRGN